MNRYHYLFKLIIVGDSGVGKSCFVQQFIENTVRESHDVTVGVEFGSKLVKIGDKDIKIQIWDTAGQENFKSITRSYYRGSIGAFLMYDVTRRQTFNHIQTWLEDVKLNGNSHIVFFLIGNKNDLQHKRQVSKEQGQQLAEKNGMMFVETNFRDSKIINQTVQKMTACILLKIQDQTIPINLQNIGIKVGDSIGRSSLSRIIKKNPHKSGCC